MTFSKKNKFVISYSGGKDGVLAMYRAMKSGMTPVGALTTFDRKNACSRFHRLPENVLKKAEESLEIPVQIVDTHGDRYAGDFEDALITYKMLGVETVVFGDIDIREHYAWCDDRCKNVGLESLFPLWGEERRKIVEELIGLDFRALITIVDTSRMSERFLGKTLTGELIEQISEEGTDACGENGEYHTFVYDGPLFRRKIEFETGKPVREGKYVYLPLY